MNRRDVSWRAAGVALIALGCAPSVAMRTDEAGVRSAVAVFGMLLAIVGIVFAINGERVARALRVERSRHRRLPLLIHTRRSAVADDRSREHGIGPAHR